MEVNKLYIKNSVPLQETKEFIIGEEYFNDEGICLKYLGEDNFEFIKRSPLISGELLSELKDDKILKLFWVLSKNM